MRHKEAYAEWVGVSHNIFSYLLLSSRSVCFGTWDLSLKTFLLGYFTLQCSKLVRLFPSNTFTELQYLRERIRAFYRSAIISTPQIGSSLVHAKLNGATTFSIMTFSITINKSRHSEEWQSMRSVFMMGVSHAECRLCRL